MFSYGFVKSFPLYGVLVAGDLRRGINALLRDGLS